MADDVLSPDELVSDGVMVRHLKEGDYYYPVPKTNLPTEQTNTSLPAYTAPPEVAQAPTLPMKRNNPMARPDPNAAPSYIMEPDLLETQQGQPNLPPGIALNDAGLPFNIKTGEEVPVVKRPNVLPIARTPDGLTFAMPKMLDIAGSVMSPLAAPSVATKAGEVVLGSGAVKTAVEAPPVVQAAKPFYSALENAVDTAKVGKANASTWLGYLKNQPGVKAEEINTVLKDLPEGPITKEQLQGIVKDNGVQLGEVTKGKTPIVTKPNPDEPHILEVYHPDDPTGEINGMWGEIINKDGKFTVNVPEIPKKSFNSQVEAEKFISDNSNLGNNTKYHGYQLPGGENYKETLLTLPEKNNLLPPGFKSFKSENGSYGIEFPTGHRLDGWRTESDAIKSQLRQEGNPQFKSSHWDEPNIIAHIRHNDRTVDGDKSLHIEEVQSDWGQKIRREGYKLDPKEKEVLEGNAKSVDDKLVAANAEDIMGNPDLPAALKQAVERKIISSKEADDYLKLTENERSTTPDMPFKKTWTQLAIKRMIHKAATEGYSGISYTPGEAQAARYDLSKQVDKIAVPMVNENGTRSVRIDPKGDSIPFKLMVDKNGIVEGEIGAHSTQFNGKPLSDVVGKEMADKILKLNKPNEYSGEGLKIGGEGMKAFYDHILKNEFNNIGKKYGAKVESRNLDNVMKERTGPLPEGEISNRVPQDVHYFPITPALKEKALKGFELFSSSPVLTPVQHNPFASDEKKSYKLTPVAGNPFGN